MSSFDQSRGFGAAPSSLPRQESWNASENGWGAALPVPDPRPLAYPDDLALAPGGGGFNESEREDDDDEDEEDVSVDLAPQLEGSILQRHHVWVIASTTERRYSDFVALVDALARRYPCRVLPALPPKSLQYQGHFIGQDDGFLDRRRRGLKRYLAALVHHPVLKHDALVAAFLAPTPWRPPPLASLVEESSTRTLSSADLAALPPKLDDRLADLRTHVAVAIDAWTKLAVVVERIAHRRLNQSREWDHLANAIDHAVEIESASSSKRPRHLATVDRDLSTLSRGVARVAEAERASTNRWFDGWVEDVKRHRERWCHLRDLLHRHATIVAATDHARDKLDKRLAATTAKLDALVRSSTTTTTTPSPPARETTYALEVERLESGIEADKRAIEAVNRRREFIRWCVWQEVTWVFRCTSLLRRNMKNLVESEQRFGTGFTRIWTELVDAGLGHESNDV
ncbi:hypothetical protein JCM11491_002695 [Sporobolomyces phaffii]